MWSHVTVCCLHCVMMTKQQKQSSIINYGRKVKNKTENRNSKRATKFLNNGLRNDFMLHPDKLFIFALNESYLKISFPFVSNFDLPPLELADLFSFSPFLHTRKWNISQSQNPNETENPDLAVKTCTSDVSFFACVWMEFYVHNDCFKFQIKYLCVVWFTETSVATPYRLSSMMELFNLFHWLYHSLWMEGKTVNPNLQVRLLLIQACM